MDQSFQSQAPGWDDLKTQPHVHVMGDLAELQIYRLHDRLPDHVDPVLTAYRKLRGFVKRTLPGGAWSVAQCVRAALGDVWKCDTSWLGSLTDLTWGPKAHARHIQALLTADDDKVDFDNRWQTENSETLGGGIFEGAGRAIDKDKGPLLTYLCSSWQVIRTDGDYEVRTHGSAQLGTPLIEQFRGELMQKAQARVLEWVLQVAAGGVGLLTPEAEGATTNAQVPPVDAAPASSGHAPDTDDAPHNADDIDVARDDAQAIRALHEYRGGAVAATVSPGRGDPHNQLAMRVIVSPDWPPSLNIWPRHPKIRVAIRQIDLAQMINKARKISKDMSSAIATQPASSATAESDENQDPAIAPTIDDIWQALDSEEKKPLREFLHLDDGRAVSDADPDYKPTSRMILLLDQEWCKKDAEGLNPTLEDDYGVGYLIVRLDRSDWVLWCARCLLAEEPQSTDRNRTRRSVTINTPRLYFDFQQSPGPDASQGKSTGELLFGLPIPRALARLIRPNERPAPEFEGPVAVVTTTELRDQQVGYNKGPRIVKPVWRIQKYEDQRGSCRYKTFRLRSAHGYDWIDDWFSETEFQYQQWRARERKHVPENGQETQETHGQRELRILEWGLSRYHEHGAFTPQWAPPFVLKDSHEFRHLVFMDLNFGFRRYPVSVEQSGTHDSGTNDFASNDATKRCKQFVKEVSSEEPASGLRPDWWLPLQKWLKRKPDSIEASYLKRGWIIAILGRQLPLGEGSWCDGCDLWDKGDLWDVLRHAQYEMKDSSQKAKTQPFSLFADKVVVILSGNLLRASGARISRRLSWERTAVDCIRELEANKRFQPLLEFRHLIVRFGCSGAVHLSRIRNPVDGERRCHSLFYDATAKDGFHRDLTRNGHVIGANSVFAARILQQLLSVTPANKDSIDDTIEASAEDQLVHKGICQAILDCQDLYDLGYGQFFREQDRYKIDYSAPEALLFSSRF